jgi:opacity protein-like surface antigen
MNSCTRSLAALALAACASLPAMAADGIRPVIGATLTGGGDTLATVYYTNGSAKDVKSGGLIHMFGGAEYRKGQFALQATLGYHVDNTSASNGSVSFSRMPLEVLGFWQPSDKWRLGGGLRKAISPELSSSGAASSLGNFSFEADVGFVLQAEYFLGGDKISTYLRYVSEDYTTNGASLSGNHVGLGLAYRF